MKIAELEELRRAARAANCTGPALFWHGTAEELSSVCNGVGSEAMPEPLRDALTYLYRKYKPAAAIHDCRYEISDGTDNNRDDADEEFRDNCLRLWRKRYGWTRWFRPSARYEHAKISAAYLALVSFGGPAWRSAYQQRVKRGEA